MQGKNSSTGEAESKRKFFKKVIGYSFLIAGIGVLLLTIIRGGVGYQEGLFSFTEVEYLETVADVESGFLPVIELQDNEPPQLLDGTLEAVYLTSEAEAGNSGATENDEEDLHEQIPLTIKIQKINLDEDIVPAEKNKFVIDNINYFTWLAPEEAVGWQYDSAQLGRPGNTVLIGHHNILGSVFKDLVDLEVGDIIVVSTVDQDYEYEIREVLILLEKEQPLEVRLENAKWLWETIDERVTLVTCWPKYDNSHRLIILALPVK